MKSWLGILVAILSIGLFFVAPNEAFALPAVSTPEFKLAGTETLQTVMAEQWLKVSDDVDTLEGLCFDRKNNLWLVGVESGKVYKITPDKKIQVVMTLKDRRPAGLKIHKDGRIFVACLGNGVDNGSVISFNPDGSDIKVIVPENAGYVPDDLFFDNEGGFYFTNFKGYYSNPIGSVEYVSPDYKTITRAFGNLCGPNGIVMSPLWPGVLYVSECYGARLDGFQLKAPTSSVVWHYQGYVFPDSIETDAAGNIYQAIYGQARVIIFSSFGNPFAHVIIPDGLQGHMLNVTHSAIIPGTDQLIICTSDLPNPGTALYTVKAPAKAWDGYYQFQKSDN